VSFNTTKDVWGEWFGVIVQQRNDEQTKAQSNKQFLGSPQDFAAFCSLIALPKSSPSKLIYQCGCDIEFFG